jgi:hypothetical protein
MMVTKKKNITPENLELYEVLMHSVPEIEIKGATMPYTSVNGNMFSFLKEGMVALRLPEEKRDEFIKKFKSRLFETYGTVMKEYVTISPALLKKTNELKPYVKISAGYAKTLKIKPSKKKSS